MYKSGDYGDALNEFTKVIAMEPENYVGDNFARVTDIKKVASFNVACCHGKMGAQDLGLKALRDSLNAGFDDYKKIKTDPDLKELREMDPKKFKELIDQYDE